MNRSDASALAGDLLDCAGRLRDMGLPGLAEDCEHAASEVSKKGRDSVPPLYESNQPVRTAAIQAFRNVRKLLKDVK